MKQLNELEGLVGSLKALAACHRIISNSLLPLAEHKSAENCISFLTELHKETLAQALAHPDADSNSELAAFKQSQTQQTNNVNTQQSQE